MNCGRGADNPLDSLRFFERPADERQQQATGGGARPAPLLRARRQPLSTYASRLPATFEERALRIFVTDAAALPAARTAFARWCEASEPPLCNEECELREAQY